MTAFECSVYELRQYTLRPHSREAFAGLFDREFVESQEAAGIRVIGQYRDLDRPDVFVWIRGFADMDSRRESLGVFYGGPAWAAHRTVANSMMLDSDDVLLLAPAGGGPSLDAHAGPRPPAGAGPHRAGTVLVADIYSLGETGAGRFGDLCGRAAGLLAAAGGEPLAALRTCTAANDFPRLPVREGEDVLVTVARFPDAADRARHARDPATGRAWPAALPGPGMPSGARVQALRLAPTKRSALA